MAALILLVLFVVFGAIALTAILVLRGSAESEAKGRDVPLDVVIEERTRSDQFPRAAALFSLLLLPIGLIFFTRVVIGAAMSAGSNVGGGVPIAVALLVPTLLSVYALMFATSKGTRSIAGIPLVVQGGLIVAIVALRK